MKGELVKKASNLLNTCTFKFRQYSPEILMGLGIVGTVTSAVLACKQTLKVSGVIDDAKENINKVKEATELENIDYTEEDATKDLTIIYAQTGVKLIKLYAPSVILGALSITSIISGHKILKTRNLALAAAYTTLEKGFKKYRSNVVEKFGEEVDKQLRYNTKVAEIETVDEKGKKKKEKVEEIDTDCVSKYSPYARFFDELSRDYRKDAEYNLMFLRRQQDYANEKLKARVIYDRKTGKVKKPGYLFLNEVYDDLDIPRSKAGQIVGWVYNPDNNPDGDNYVDFGIYNNNSHRFVNGVEKGILLDFNVDGPIDYILDNDNI